MHVLYKSMGHDSLHILSIATARRLWQVWADYRAFQPFGKFKALLWTSEPQLIARWSRSVVYELYAPFASCLFIRESSNITRPWGSARDSFERNIKWEGRFNPHTAPVTCDKRLIRLPLFAPRVGRFRVIHINFRLPIPLVDDMPLPGMMTETTL